MTPYPNLISESLLINESIALLRSFGGKASAVSVVDFVMKIRRPDPYLARLLVTDLIARDPRLKLTEDTVELPTGENVVRKTGNLSYSILRQPEPRRRRAASLRLVPIASGTAR